MVYSLCSLWNLCICECVHVCIYVSLHVCVYVRVCVYVHVCLYVHVYVHVYVSAYVYVYAEYVYVQHMPACRQCSIYLSLWPSFSLSACLSMVMLRTRNYLYKHSIVCLLKRRQHSGGTYASFRAAGFRVGSGAGVADKASGLGVRVYLNLPKPILLQGTCKVDTGSVPGRRIIYKKY